MTHSVLSRRSCGILSGILRISVITWPAFLMRLFSSFWANAGRPTNNITAINEKILFIDVLLFCPFPIISSNILGTFEPSGISPADTSLFTSSLYQRR